MLSEIYAKSFDVDIVLTRSFNHIGPGQKDIFVISSFAHKLTSLKKDDSAAKQMTVGNIAVVRDFVDVRDVVKAYYLLFQQGRRGEVYNICSGEGSSLERVLETMSDILDIKVNFNADASLMRPDENKVIIGSNEKISRETGWKRTFNLKQSLEDIIGYWMEKK
jgi:GDP-4-dehydro-6-deoxy-D-mannose reductase